MSSRREYLACPYALPLASWQLNSCETGLFLPPPRPINIISTTNTSLSIIKKYLVVASHKLCHGMQNSFATELPWCGCFKYIVYLHLFRSIQLCSLYFPEYASGYSMMIFRYVVLFASLFVYLIMTTYMGSACRISASKESGSLSAFQVFYFSILL